MRPLQTRRFVFMINQNKKQKRRIDALESIVRASLKQKDILTFDEISVEFNMSRSTFDRYRANGLKYSKPNGGKIYVRRVDLEEFLKRKNSYGRFN